MNAEDVRRLLRAKIRESGSCLGFSKSNKVHRTQVQHFLAGDEPNPQPRVLQALRLRKVVTYEPIE